MQVAGRLDLEAVVCNFNSADEGECTWQSSRRCSGEVDAWREERNGRLRPAKVK